MGLFCGFIGAFLLIAPHRFQSGPYKALLPHALAWGTLALPPAWGCWRPSCCVHGRWMGVPSTSCVGLTLLDARRQLRPGGRGLGGARSTPSSGWRRPARGLRPPPAPPLDGEGDLFGLAMGVVATARGLLADGRPHALPAAVLRSPPAAFLRLLGLTLLLTGPLLALARSSLRASRRQLLGDPASSRGRFFVAFGVLFALPGRSGRESSLYCGGGVDARRPALAAAAAGGARYRGAAGAALSGAGDRHHAGALILATAVVTAQEEQLADEQARPPSASRRRSIAQNVSDYIEMNGARTATLAAVAGRAPLTARGAGRAAGELAADVSGARRAAHRHARRQVVAAAGAVALPLPAVLRPGRGRHPGARPRMQLTTAPARRPFAAAARRRRSTTPGGVSWARWSRPTTPRSWSGGSPARGPRVALADGLGEAHRRWSTVCQPDAERLPRSTRPAGTGRPCRRRAGPERRWPASRGYHGSAGRWPSSAPEADALAGVRRGRDLAFCLLLAVIPVAAWSRHLAWRAASPVPWQISRSAVDEMTAGNLAAPLGRRQLRSPRWPVSRRAFREMRDRLAARTRESERLAAELRARAEALAETDRRKDEFLAMLAHELRNPLGAIANASYLLEQLGPSSPPMDRSVVGAVRRNPGRCDGLGHLFQRRVADPQGDSALDRLTRR